MKIDSHVIGEKVLKRLLDLDLIAYIRFASVYRQFGDVDTFLTELKKLKKEQDQSKKQKALAAGAIHAWAKKGNLPDGCKVITGSEPTDDGQYHLYIALETVEEE